jgi:rhodanese-related sulfurtransferase/predicted transcriptional regulator
MPSFKHLNERLNIGHSSEEVFAIWKSSQYSYSCLNSWGKHMAKRESAKKELFTLFARVAKALASPNRLEILEILAQGERGVEAVAAAAGLSIANTSHHLQVLRDGGLVKSRKEGVQVIYGLSDEEIPALLSQLRQVGERHLAEVNQIVREHFENKDNLTPVRHKELLKMVRAGEAMVIDVRPRSEYEAGHIRGAINLPLSELPRRLSELPKDQEIVAYCRGPYCMLAFDAVAQLRKRGFHARRLEDGFPEWQAEHQPIEKKR